jgi:deoxyribodipyrimidine photo-lyase
MNNSVVWFKKDFRVHDHAALAAAVKRGRVCCLYIIEPSLWRSPDASAQHYAFTLECLRDLYVAIKRLGGQLHVVTGEALEVLQRLHTHMPFDALYSHQETGNAPSYARDLAIGAWCRQRGITWHEPPQFGVIRRLRNRNLWQPAWEAHMQQPCIAPPDQIKALALPWAEPRPPSAKELGIDPLDPPQRQKGGRQAALEILNDFLNSRSEQYRGGISSPLSAPTACSRISPYLTYGCLSMREVVHAVTEMLGQISTESRRAKGLRAFMSRLYWHCHFIQKLESEPELEWQNLHRGYDGLREDDWNAEYFEALCEARTGWPLVDACVLMLKDMGWINFRMRAMLVSTAAYPLWLHWREVGQWLARHFLDYEPGIHWSQMQMQSGTTGINVPRIYNPIKQARDHDPNGVFVRRWIPALRQVPNTWLFEPWRLTPELKQQFGIYDAHAIPAPVVDLEFATREAKHRLYDRRGQATVKAAKKEIIEKHASRKNSGQRQAARDTPTLRNARNKRDHSVNPPTQHTLDFS